MIVLVITSSQLGFVFIKLTLLSGLPILIMCPKYLIRKLYVSTLNRNWSIQ